jgi:hypothetical protein
VRLSRHFALCLLFLLPCGVRADEIGPAQAQAVQRQLKEWLTGLLGPGTVPDLPLRVAGEGDHYRMTWPLSGLDSPANDAAATASVRPLDGGRWAIDAIKLPDAASVTVALPNSGAASTGGPLKAAFTIGRQDSHGVIDPSLATGSTLHIELGNLAITTDNTREHQEQLIDRYAADTSLKPAQNGRLDVAMDATIEGWKSAARVEGGAAIAIAAQSMRAIGRIEGVNRDKVAAVGSAMGAFFRALPPDVMEKHGNDALPAPARAQLRAVIAALPDMLTGVRLEETIDGLQVELAGMGGLALKRILLGFGSEAPDGMLHAWFQIGLDGLDTPTLPPKVVAYLPHHIELRPSISGIRTADLTKLGLDATDETGGDDRLAADVAAIFAQGGVNLGVETLSFDLGPAKIAGVGKLVALSPESWRGDARLTATGLDELTAQARTDPDLQQALPVLIMLRGLAKPDGDRLVWDIASEGSAVTVNGIDLSQLGAEKPKAKPPRKPQGQPGRQ